MPSVNTKNTHHFYWCCDDCRRSGSVDIKLPQQVRTLYGLLEDDHRHARGPVCCPSDYFQVTAVDLIPASPAVEKEPA